MTPKAHFDDVWARCEQLSALHGYIAANVAAALKPDELLRAEWVARVSALDLFVHELVAQQMFAIFEGLRTASSGYNRFRVSNETLNRIRAAATPIDAGAAFELEVRTQLSTLTFQDPEKIADGVRLFSDVELWNEIALLGGATPANKIAAAKSLKQDLSAVVQRRNKIAHEGDLQPGPPRSPWPISRADLNVVSSLIVRVVEAIEGVTK